MPEAVTVAVNDAFLRLFEYTREELLGKTSVDLGIADPDSQAQARAELRAHGSVRDFECIRLTKSGARRVLSLNIDWVSIGGEKHVLTTIQDITDRKEAERVRLESEEIKRLYKKAKEAEEELRLSEAKSSGVLSISADAIISIDEDQRITMFNDGAEKIFGYSKAEAIGASLDILIPERLRARHRQHVERFAVGQETARPMNGRDVAIFGLRKNGEEFPADAAISKLEVGGKRILTVALRDITEQKRIENEQRFLAEVGPVLATTLDYEETLTRIAQLAVRNLADLCIVDVVGEDGEVRRLKVVSRDPSKAWVCDLLTGIPLDRKRPHLVYSALETKRPVLMERLTPEMVASFSQNEEYLRALRAVDPKSMIAAPLLAHGQLLGVIALVSSTSFRVYGPADVRLAEELAHRGRSRN